MTYDNLAQGFILQLTVAPIGAVCLLVCAIMISSKFSLPGILVNILLNVGIYTFPLSWILSLIMISYTHTPDNDMYNKIWHAFPFAVVFISSILVWVYIKFLRTPR
jgi:hypothetical protein